MDFVTLGIGLAMGLLIGIGIGRCLTMMCC